MAVGTFWKRLKPTASDDPYNPSPLCATRASVRGIKAACQKVKTLRVLEVGFDGVRRRTRTTKAKSPSSWGTFLPQVDPECPCQLKGLPRTACSKSSPFLDFVAVLSGSYPYILAVRSTPCSDCFANLNGRSGFCSQFASSTLISSTDYSTG